MRRILVMLAASAAFATAASAASAADCVNGYRMLPNQVILTCHDFGPSAGATTSAMAAKREAPLYTGSIGTSTASAKPTRHGSIIVEDEEACRPGEYREMDNPNGSTFLPCR